MRNLFLLTSPVFLLATTAGLAHTQRPALLDTTRVQVASLAARGVAPSSRSVELLDRAAIARWPGVTLGEVLARALGVDLPIRSPASADLSIRGGSFEQVLVLVDGVRMSDDQSGHFDLDLALPLDMVERIEILRGTGSALHGADAVGGVVNIVTRQALATTARARVQGGSFGAAGGSATLGLTRSRASVLGSADLQRSDGHRPGTDFDIAQGRIAAGMATRAGMLRADLAAARRDFGAADFYGVYPSHERTGTLTSSLQLDARPASRVRTTATLGARQHTDRFTLYRDEPARYQNRHESWQFDGEVVARVEGAAATGALGLSGRGSRLRSARLGNREESRAALFGEASIGSDAGARLDLGVRGDWSSVFGGYLSPTIAAAIPVGAHLHLRASGAGGFRTPTWTERFYQDPANVGDSTLASEHFWSAELGTRVTARSLRADVALFLRQADQLIDWARPRGSAPDVVWHTTNVKDARFLGGEFSLDVVDALGTEWSVRAMGLDVAASDADGFEGKYALRPLTRTASLRASRILFGGLSLSTELAHGRRAYEAGWERIDGRLSWTRARTRIDLDFVNLGGADYLDAVGKPVAGRSVVIGIGFDVTRN